MSQILSRSRQPSLDALQHRLDVVGNLEWSFGLGFDVVDCDPVGEFDQGESVREIDVEDALYQVSNVLTNFKSPSRGVSTHQLRNNPTNTRPPRKRELALFQNLRIALLIRMFHQGHHLCLLRIGHQIHRAAEPLHLAR